ncbi:MAG TPA: hypothetical protein VKY40_03305 [Halanaerobiales bacterium]|nr:hypothetical protein [Halanaerobiales bacterium]
MRIDFNDDTDEEDFVYIPEKIGYFALVLAIVKGYSASQALRYVTKGESK